MELEFSIWDFVRDAWRWIRNLSPIRIDHTKVTLTFASMENGHTELKDVKFKLSMLNHSTNKIFVKFSNPIFRHDKKAYNLYCESPDLSTTKELSPRSVTVFDFQFGIIGGLTTVQDYKPNTFQFEITYIRDGKIEKVFVDDYNQIVQRSIMKFEPIEDTRPTHHFREGMQFLIKGENSKAYESFEKSGYTRIELAVFLARNGDGYLFNQQFTEAIIVYKKAKKLFQDEGLSPTDPILAILNGNLATACCYNEEYKEALPLFENSISILSQEIGMEEALKKLKEKQEDCLKGRE